MEHSNRIEINFLNFELLQFLDYLKQTYPYEASQVNYLIEKLHKQNRKLVNIDKLDNLTESLAKAKALSVTALMYDNFAALDEKIISNYLWALNEFITNAYNLATSI